MLYIKELLYKVLNCHLWELASYLFTESVQHIKHIYTCFHSWCGRSIFLSAYIFFTFSFYVIQMQNIDVKIYMKLCRTCYLPHSNLPTLPSVFFYIFHSVFIAVKWWISQHILKIRLQLWLWNRNYYLALNLSTERDNKCTN